MNNFQSIITAPKDRDILVSDGNGYYAVVCWDEEDWCFDSGEDEHGYNVTCKINFDPLYWMYLPDGISENLAWESVPKINNCPFCGSSDVFTESETFSACVVVCSDCGANGPASDPNDQEEVRLEEEHDLDSGTIAAIKAWNVVGEKNNE